MANLEAIKVSYNGDSPVICIFDTDNYGSNTFEFHCLPFTFVNPNQSSIATSTPYVRQCIYYSQSEICYTPLQAQIGIGMFLASCIIVVFFGIYLYKRI